MGTPTARTLSETVYERLRNDIIAGRLGPDTKLRIEELRDAYNTGASPLREALNRLAGEGFVTAAGQRGFTVTAISLKDLDEVTHLRILLEGEAIEHSIRAGDDHWEANLVAAFHHLSKVDALRERDVGIWEQRNQAFHEALIAACDSSWLLRLRRTLYEQHKRYRLISILGEDHSRDIHAEHKAIFEAALSHDVVAARTATAEHIQRTAQTTRAAFAHYAENLARA